MQIDNSQVTKEFVTLKYLNGFCVPEGGEENKVLAATLSAELVNLGFMPDEKLLKAFSTLPADKAEKFYKNFVAACQLAKGAHVEHTPMYPNFPTQVMEASDVELFVNAVLHYWSRGQWLPSYDKIPRVKEFEKYSPINVTAVTEEDFLGIFTILLSSKDSISEFDKRIIAGFLDGDFPLKFPEEIPHKETLAFVASELLKRGINIKYIVKTTTDILRIATALSGGDISLGENTKFKSLPRHYRKTLCKALELVANMEDFKRHRNKWIRLFHMLHVGEYSPNLYEMAKVIRSNANIPTFYTKVEALINAGNVRHVVDLLDKSKRSSELVRRFRHLYHLGVSNYGPEYGKELVRVVAKNLPNVPTRVIAQFIGALQVAHIPMNARTFFPKGATQKVYVLEKEVKPIPAEIKEALLESIRYTLCDRWQKLPTLGHVYIDDALKKCPLPTQMRSASSGYRVLARGTRIPIGTEQDTIRMFVYWKGVDIDLSATFLNSNIEYVGHVSYTRLREDVGEGEYVACHSGDITDAPNGASEFIDINIPKALKKGTRGITPRYVAMHVHVYAGPTFKEHEECFAGFMLREKPASNEIFEPKTVEHKIDLCSESKVCIPFLFDLWTREAIYVDVTKNTRDLIGGNNLESNLGGITYVVKAYLNLDNKLSLHDLFLLHAIARGKGLVGKPESADTVFSLTEGITPYDVARINSEFMI